MPSVECFRHFFNERLTTAAEEIFKEFEKTIVEYEEEIKNVRRMLDIALKRDLQSVKKELPQQHEYIKEEEEEFLSEQPYNQEDNSVILYPYPPQIKEEEEELCTSYDTAKLVLKKETDNFMLTLAYKEGDHSENQTVSLNTVKTFEDSEPSTDHQVLHQNSKNGGSVPVRNKKPQSTRHSNTAQNNSVVMSTTPKSPDNSKTCDICGKILRDKYKLMRHQRIHTGERPSSCNICNKTFRDSSDLRRHIKTHTGVKPYCCNLCGRRFKEMSHLRGHSRIHTGEKSYSCKQCKKEFRYRGDLSAHKKTHIDVTKATLM